jgi:threonyl-tRNA synthetase
MSLKFAIIPLSQNFDHNAYDIKSKLLDSIKLPLTIEVDLDYSKSYDSKKLKWIKKKYDVIIIDDDVTKNNRITVLFSDKGSKPTTMEIDEFIDLVASFEDDDVDKNKDNNEQNVKNCDKIITQYEPPSEDNNEGGCIIM